MTSITRRREQDDSGEYSDASQDIELNNSRNDGVAQESDYDSRGSEFEHDPEQDLERDPENDPEGDPEDPENQEKERRVDDDEDRSNPQYIPKRGTFYEHDDRTAASGEESSNTTSETLSEKKEGSETPAERRRPPRKSDVINKWSHDKYNENEQVPKSREELVAIYGYDIRNEDAPPHARRNRRYGRGPNKYTRTWEDEEAYRRQTAQAAATPRKPPNPEDFPELDAAARRHSRKPRTPRPRSKSQPTSNESLENGSQLRRNASIKSPKRTPPKRTENVANRNVSKPLGRQDIRKEKMPALENLTITTSVLNNGSEQQPQRRVAAVAQQRPVPTDQGRKKPPQSQQANQSTNKSPPQQQQKPQQPQQNQQPQQQPASGAEPRGGSKRYSSLRQRPLAETYSPQQQQQPQQQMPQPQQQMPQPQMPQSQQQQAPQQQQLRYHAGPPPGEFPAPHQPGQPLPHPQQLIHQQVHRGGTHAPSPPHQSLPQPLPQSLPQPLPQSLPQPLPQTLPQPQPQHNQQQVRLGIMEQQQQQQQQQQQLVPHQHNLPLHNLPQPHNIGPMPPSQAYAPPAMMPAQYMQSGSGAVFGGAGMFAQPPAPAYHPHQIYPHHNYLVPVINQTKSNEATQAGGVTYYSCAEQEQQPRAQRRPTAAIPIVRPHHPPHQDRPVNSSEKDNIDRIVENMFVRKPWPATHGAESKEKSQTDNRSSQEPPSKESSQPNSLTSSSISTDSKPSESREETKEIEEVKESKREEIQESEVPQESITTNA